MSGRKRGVVNLDFPLPGENMGTFAWKVYLICPPIRLTLLMAPKPIVTIFVHDRHPSVINTVMYDYVMGEPYIEAVFCLTTFI